MAITAAQQRALNNLSKYVPGLKKGQLSAADQIKLGDLMAQIQLATIVTATPAAVATADADATYGQPEADLINELKDQVNLLITLVDEIRTSINAGSA